MDAFLETYKLPKLKQEETQNLNRPVTSKENWSSYQKSPNERNSKADGFPGELYQTFKKELIPTLLKQFQKHRHGRKSSKLFLWHQHYLDPKDRQRPHQKGELQPRNKSHLVVVNHPFNVMLDPVGKYLGENFCIHVHQRYWSVILLFGGSLSVFGIKVMLAS